MKAPRGLDKALFQKLVTGEWIAKIGRHNVKVRLQCASNRVPTAAVVAAAMDKDQRRRRIITPFSIMQLQGITYACQLLMVLRMDLCDQMPPFQAPGNLGEDTKIVGAVGIEPTCQEAFEAHSDHLADANP